MTETAKPDISRFSEQDFLDYLDKAVGNGKYNQAKANQALHRLIETLPSIAETNLNPRIKLNHLHYAARIIQDNTAAKHGHRKVQQKFALIESYLEDIDLPAGGDFLDFGCGEYDPLALSAIYYLNGMKRNIACDLREPRAPRYSAIAMYDILANINMFPDIYRRDGVDPGIFRERLGTLNAGPFHKGKFEEGLELLKGKVDYRIANILDLDIADSSLSLAVSFAVLEHVKNFDEVYGWLLRKTMPGGLQFHFIDLVDHRSYGGASDYNEWTFLTHEEEHPNHNRLRSREHLDAFERAGFEILDSELFSKKIPEETRQALISPWKEMPEKEIDTIRMRVLLRRPV